MSETDNAALTESNLQSTEKREPSPPPSAFVRRTKAGLLLDASSHLRLAGATALAVFVLAFAVGMMLPANRVGDGMEYYAMYFAWADGLRPWATPDTFDIYQQMHLSGAVSDTMPGQWLYDQMPALRVGSTSDFNHFWFYSALAALVAAPFDLVGVHFGAHGAFMLLHGLLLAFAVGVATACHGWKGAGAVLVLFMTSPLIWYINKVHTELFTFCLSVAAISLLMKGRLTLAAMLMAGVATQNPGLLVVPFTLVALRVGLHWRSSYSPFEAAALACTIGLMAIHPVYYLARYNVITPQLLAGGAEPGAALDVSYIWFVDPDIGLFANWPLGLALIVGGILCWRHLRTSSVPGRGPELTAAWPLAIGMAVFFLVSLYSQSSTTNLNSGASPGVSRYGLWYVALIYPFSLAMLTWASRSRILMGGTFVIATISGAMTFSWNNPVRPENSGKPNFLSAYVQTSLPGLYSPPAEIFLERYSGRGEATAGIGALVGPDCRKTLLLPTTSPGLETLVPLSCEFKPSQIAKWVVGARGEHADYQNLAASDISPMPRAAVGQPVSFAAGSEIGSLTLTSGWSTPEPWGVWSLGPRAIVDVPLSDIPTVGTGVVTIELNSFVVPSSPTRSTHIRVNGGASNAVAFDLDAPSRSISIPINSAELKSSGALHIEIDIANPISPKAAGVSEDGRPLGVGLVSLTVKVEP